MKRGNVCIHTGVLTHQHHTTEKWWLNDRFTYVIQTACAACVCAVIALIFSFKSGCTSNMCIFNKIQVHIAGSACNLLNTCICETEGELKLL